MKLHMLWKCDPQDCNRGRKLLWEFVGSVLGPPHFSGVLSSLSILLPLTNTISGTSIPQSGPVTGAPALFLQLLTVALPKRGSLLEKYPCILQIK